MSAHYKQPLDWNEKLLEDCKNTIDKWYEVYLPSNDKTILDENILSPLYDDLNTPGYIANLHLESVHHLLMWCQIYIVVLYSFKFPNCFTIFIFY